MIESARLQMDGGMEQRVSVMSVSVSGRVKGARMILGCQRRTKYHGTSLAVGLCFWMEVGDVAAIFRDFDAAAGMRNPD